MRSYSIKDETKEIFLDKPKIKRYGREDEIEGEENAGLLISGSKIKRIMVPERSFKKHYESMGHISQAFYCIILAIGFFFLSWSAHLTGNYMSNLKLPSVSLASLESFYGGLSPIFLALTIIVLCSSVWIAQKDFDNWRSSLVLSPPITFVALFFSLLAILLIIFNMKISQALILIFALAFISPLYIKTINWLEKHKGSIKEDCREEIKKKIGNWKSFLSLPSPNVFMDAFAVLLAILLIILITQISQVLIFKAPFFSLLSKLLVIFEISQLLIFIFVFSLLCITISTWLKKPIKGCFDKIKKDFDDNTKLLEEVIQQFYLKLSCNDKDKARISAIKDEILEKYEKDEKKKIEKFIKKLDELKKDEEYLENEDFNIILKFKYFIKKEKG